MTHAASETKISLVGWGDDQIILHSKSSITGVSLWRAGRLRAFALSPWLSGCVAIIKAPTVYDHTLPSDYDKKLVGFLRSEAIKAAREAILANDIYLMSEAVITTYTAQQMMGGELLPNYGEIGKRYAGSYGVYVFPTPDRTKKFLSTSAVLTT
jgi:hypothetical protein